MITVRPGVNQTGRLCVSLVSKVSDHKFDVVSSVNMKEIPCLESVSEAILDLDIQSASDSRLVFNIVGVCRMCYG